MIIRNAKLYRELSEPFASEEAANEALAAFQVELYELRKKHRIKDLVTIAGIGMVHPDGEEIECQVTINYGSSERKVSMLAFAYGEAVEESRRAPMDARLQGEETARRRRKRGDDDE